MQKATGLVRPLVVRVAVSGLVAGCSAPAAPPPATPAPADPTATEHAHAHGAPMNLPPVGPTVTVSLDGKPVSVELAKVPHDPGATSVPLSAVWSAAWPAEDPAPLTFDFMGSDGFRPAKRAPCAALLHGADVATTRVDLTTHDLLFADGVKLPGCYRVHAVVEIDGAR